MTNSPHTIPDLCLREHKTLHYFRPKRLKSVLNFRTQGSKNHTLWCGLYRYGLYKKIPSSSYVICRLCHKLEWRDWNLKLKKTNINPEGLTDVELLLKNRLKRIRMQTQLCWGGYVKLFWFFYFSQEPFDKFGTSLMTMYVMTLGELNYDDNFTPWEKLNFATLANTLFVVLVLGMPIIMMNMLVGDEKYGTIQFHTI